MELVIFAVVAQSIEEPILSLLLPEEFLPEKDWW